MNYLTSDVQVPVQEKLPHTKEDKSPPWINSPIVFLLREKIYLKFLTNTSKEQL